MEIAQFKSIKQNFVRELKAANAGKKTSLPFIVHKLSSAPIVEDGEDFEALVIGGSIFKRAICKKTIDKISIIKKERELPLTFKTEKEFLEFIDGELSKDVNILSLNFAYPIKPVFENGKLDGILLAVTKEGGFDGLVGKKVGKEIEGYIFRKRKKKISVSIANDTICLLLSGLTRYRWSELAAGIVGTGLNLAIFLDKEGLVNLESASFDKFPQSKEGKIIDQQSVKPGRALFEKETAGAYLYKHFSLIVKSKKINFSAIRSTEELDSLSRKNIPQVSRIAQNLIKRSAQLVACQIAGITELKKHSMVFNMEGSLFWKGNNYRETVEETVRLLVPEYNVKFVEIENSAILGAAKLVA